MANRRCEKDSCLMHKKNNTCNALTDPYSTAERCPFFKDKTKLPKEEIDAYQPWFDPNYNSEYEGPSPERTLELVRKGRKIREALGL